jgi:hypothetical protein
MAYWFQIQAVIRLLKWKVSITLAFGNVGNVANASSVNRSLRMKRVSLPGDRLLELLRGKREVPSVSILREATWLLESTRVVGNLSGCVGVWPVVTALDFAVNQLKSEIVAPMSAIPAKRINAIRPDGTLNSQSL